MAARPRHPRTDLEQVLQMAEARNWRVERGSKYYRLLCPCEGMHMKSVHLTPSDPKYRRNLLSWLSRCACWKGGGS